MTRFIPSTKPALEENPERREAPNPGMGIDPALLDLVRLRMAQITESPIGMEKHRLDLEARGESAERLEHLPKWRESALFSDKEKAALTLGEAVFQDPTKPVFNQHLEKTRRYFEKDEIVSLLLAIMAISDWSYFTASDTTEEVFPPKPSKMQTHSLPLYWRKLAHQLAERANGAE
ncbi:MAG TPA: hypothetical protein VL981_08215 [Candidatus Methylacidiphilales bacterium]|nr:hypothetical protein [Candidatus Methylacidiphilales bacterium]